MKGYLGSLGTQRRIHGRGGQRPGRKKIVNACAMLAALFCIGLTGLFVQHGRRVKADNSLLRISMPKSSAEHTGFPAMVRGLQTGPPTTSQSLTAASTPLGMAPGAPAGSFALSGFDNVNLYNGNLNISLPLLHIGGRGTIGYTMTLALNTKRWQIHQVSCPFPTNPDCPPSGIYLSPNDLPYESVLPGYSPGLLVARVSGNFCSPTATGQLQGLTLLTFIDPQGTEHQLVDTVSQGEYIPIVNTGSGCASTMSRGPFFDSMDGSAMQFFSCDPNGNAEPISDVAMAGMPSPTAGLAGFLTLRDGTTYRIDDGLVSWIADRNGNQVTFAYQNGQVTNITDCLGRQITITYATQQNPVDTITYPGFNGATRTITVNYASLTAPGMLRADVGSLPTLAELFPDPNDPIIPGATYPLNPQDPELFVSSVVLPEPSLSYTFQYNGYGEVARIDLPTGGAYEYDYTVPEANNANDMLIMFGASLDLMVYRRLTEKRTYTTQTGGWLTSTFVPNYVEREDYAPTYLNAGTDTAEHAILNTMVNVTHYGAVGSPLLASENHYFHGQPTEAPNPYPYPWFTDSKEYQTDFLAADNATVLRSRMDNWTQSNPVSWWSTTGLPPNESPENTPHIANSISFLEDVAPNLQSQESFAYDGFNNVTDDQVDDYAVGSPRLSFTNTPGPLLRETVTTYLTTNPSQGGIDYTGTVNSTGLHIVNLPFTVIVYGPGGASGPEAAETDYEYDNYAANSITGPPPCNTIIVRHANLANCSGISNHEFGTSYYTRGNVTNIARQIFSVGSTACATTTVANTYMLYDIAGNVVAAVDPNGNTSTISYLDTYGFSLPTERQTPPPDCTGTTGSASALITMDAYDFSTSKLTSETDPNGNMTTASYSDPLDRLTSVNLPDGGSTSYLYNDVAGNWFVQSTTLASPSPSIVTAKFVDGLGRPIGGETAETSTTVICTQQTYDGMGRVLLTYNPFRLTGVSGPPTAPAGSPFTQNNYDLVGRVTTVTEADGSTLNSVYANNQTMVVDEGGAERISQVDGLGELTNVWEITTATDIWTTSVAFAGSLPTGVPVPAQGYLTTYTYDPLSDLINAAQATNGARDFTYDSLRRLTSATTPETGTYFQSGTTCYLYDLNSDLISKLDPRNVTTAYTYDALNRLTSRQYTIPAGTADPTPNVSYFYDGLGATSQVPNALGRLTEMTSSVSENEYTAYDPMGRVTGFTQLTNSQPYLMSYSYDLVGHVITEGYPSGRTVTNQYDQVGRIMNIQSGAEPPYQSSFSYAPFGGITSVTLGNNLVEATQYNARLQPTNIQLGPSGNLFNLTLAYNSGTDNGNLASETLAIVTNSTTNTWTQNYSYDSLNRITGATEKYNSAQTWSRSFKYDPVGNMWVSAATGIGITPATPQAQTAFNWKNQFASSTATYDPAGNLTTDLESNTYTYDAENKQAECTIINTGQGAGAPEYSYYFYDGDGHRVGKAVGTTVNGTGGTIATFVYNAGGALVAEYGGPALTDSGTSYLTTDHLSSTRVVTDSNGNPRRHDFLPFGEEINSSVDLATTGRSNVAGYVSSDDTRQKFTGKERDPESNLDYFNARYYSSPSGRFMSPDPLLIEMNRLRDPQQMNLYSYTRGNPLRFTDPLGLDITVRGDRSADYLEALQRAVSFKIALKGDKVVIEGDVDKKNLSKSDKVLLQAISDTKHHVSIDAIDGSKEPLVFFGRSDAPHSGTHTIAFGQVAMLDRDKNAGGLSSSQLVGHETVEGYAESKGDSMTDAHNYANQFFGGLDPGTGGTYTTENGMVTEITGNFTVHGTKTKESITLHLVTPVPKEDFLKGKGAPYQNYPVDVVKK